MHLKSLSYICSSWCNVINLLLLLFKLKFKLYLSVTQTPSQATNDTVESDTYPTVYLIYILYTQLYLRCVGTIIRDGYRGHIVTEAQSVNIKTYMHPFSHSTSVFI